MQLNFLRELNFQMKKKLLKDLFAEINARLHYLQKIGLGYLNLIENQYTFGGESQRINMAKSISSSLVGSMYILDEPSISYIPKL